MDKEKLKKLEEKIRDEELIEIYKDVIKIIACSIIGAIIGYCFCKDNQYTPIKGILLGIAWPWGYIVIDRISKFLYSYLEDLYHLVCLCTVGIYVVIWFIVKVYISAYVGLVAGPILAICYIVKIKKVWKKDYSKEAEGRYYIEYSNNIKRNNTFNRNDVVKNIDIPIKYEDEKYYCEMCFKDISEEEYELYECMCEECYMDIHTDEKGNFREDYYKY